MTADRPAGFWIRAVAALVDLAILLVVRISFALIGSRVAGPGMEEATVAPLVGLFTLAFAFAYTSALHALGGQTIGKMLVGVRVVSVDGAPVAPGAALLRFVGYAVSLMPLGLGFFMAGLRRDRRALHDLLAGTRVAHVRAPVPRPALLESAEAATPSGVG